MAFGRAGEKRKREGGGPNIKEKTKGEEVFWGDENRTSTAVKKSSGWYLYSKNKGFEKGDGETD